MNIVVLIIGPFPDPVDGVSLANDTLYKNLIKRGIRCNKINSNAKSISSNQGTSFSIKKAFLFLHTFLKIYKVFFTDVVYTTPGQTFFGILKYAPFYFLCILLKKPYIIHVHGNYLGREFNSLQGLKKRIFHFLISKASAGIVLSKSLRRNFMGILSDDKIFVVENFVSDELYKVEIVKQIDKIHLLFLSNLMREKGILELLDALIILTTRNINFKAVIAGSIETDFKNEIFSKFEMLSKKVEYVGTIKGEQKKKELFAANVFVLPTYYKMEGQPISLLEGMATGNIILTTPHAGIPDIISEANGFFLVPNTSETIASLLIEISENIVFYVNKFSNSNKAYAASIFTEKNFTKKIISVMSAVRK